MSFLSAIPLALVALYVTCSRRRFPADGLVQLSALTVMAGFLLATQPLLAADSGAADVALLNAGNGLFIMAAQMALVTIAARNPLGAITTDSLGKRCLGLRIAYGSCRGHACQQTPRQACQLCGWRSPQYCFWCSPPM